MTTATTYSPTIGDRLFNRGDVCNREHFGTVTNIKPGRFGTQVEVTPDEGSGRAGPYWITPAQVSTVDRGNGSTRIVTEAAYKALRQQQIEALRAEINRVTGR